MSFINQALVDVRKPLVEARFPFSRAKSLSDTMTWCATDYYTKASIGGWFEARGIVVIGDSRLLIDIPLRDAEDFTDLRDRRSIHQQAKHHSVVVAQLLVSCGVADREGRIAGLACISLISGSGLAGLLIPIRVLVIYEVMVLALLVSAGLPFGQFLLHLSQTAIFLDDRPVVLYDRADTASVADEGLFVPRTGDLPPEEVWLRLRSMPTTFRCATAPIIGVGSDPELRAVRVSAKVECQSVSWPREPKRSTVRRFLRHPSSLPCSHKGRESQCSQELLAGPSLHEGPARNISGKWLASCGPFLFVAVI